MGRLRKKPWAEDYLRDSNIVITDPIENINNWNKKLFNNNNEIWIEIGMGKGGHTLELAKQNPNKNIIGIEIFPSVQVIPVKKAEELELPNLLFISGDASNIDEWFNKESIDRIFINFPDPWPKERHAKRRLLFHTFLKRYYSILRNDSIIEFKTDQLPLFDFTIEEVEEKTKFKIENVSRNLHKEKKNIIKTEYENKFSSMGNLIYFLILRK